MQPIWTTKITLPFWIKNHATSQDKKIVQAVMTKKKFIQPLGTKKIMQPLGAKKITQPLGTKLSRNLSGQKKSRNLKG